MITRSWTPIDSDPRWEQDGYYEDVAARLDGLMKWWSQLATEAENAQFAREWDDNRYDPGEDAPRAAWYDLRENDPEFIRDLAEFEAHIAECDVNRRAAEEMKRAQVEFIEAQVYEAGARIMRPYEHWNEDERYMEYAERSR